MANGSYQGPIRGLYIADSKDSIQFVLITCSITMGYGESVPMAGEGKLSYKPTYNSSAAAAAGGAASS